MLCLLEFLLLLFLLDNDRHTTLARQTLIGRIPKPSVMAGSNSSAASSSIRANSSSHVTFSALGVYKSSLTVTNVIPTALPAPFYLNSIDETANHTQKNSANYQDVKSGFCAIGDNFCSFKGSNGTIVEAVSTSLSDQCLLWDNSCSGNRTVAIDKFFNTTFNGQFPGDPNMNGYLLDNDCFVQTDWVNQSDCNTYNPPKRLSDFQKIKNWMRSPQCVSAANDWIAMDSDRWGLIYGGGINETQAQGLSDDAFLEQIHPEETSSAFAGVPSCCGVCDVWPQNVDLYYWPEPDANFACTSIIGESVRPLDYGATTTVYSGIGEPLTDIYWGCTSTAIFPNEKQPGEFTTETFNITIAEIMTIGSLSVKVSSYSPWSSAPCIEDDAGSQSSNQSLKVRDERASVYARDHSLIVPSSITQAGGLQVSTMVSGNFTFTSPSIYANFHSISLTDSCGGSMISSMMLSFSAGELSTIVGYLGSTVYGPVADILTTKRFDFKDLPCPPQSVMEANWYKPQPGEPYRPLIAMPSQLKKINPWFSYCTNTLFTAYDPPSALTVATALVPPVPPGKPSAHPWAPASSPTMDPGIIQTVIVETSTPMPANTPTVGQPKATNFAAPAPPSKEGPNPVPQHNDPATQGSPPSQPRPSTADPNRDPKGVNDPQQNSIPQQGSDPKQDNGPNQGSDPPQGTDDNGHSGEKTDPKPNNDPNQVDSNQGSNQNVNPVPQNDANLFSDFTEGQAKTINSQVVQPLSHGISIAGTTLTPGAPTITVSGTPIYLGSSALVIGTSTVPVGSESSHPVITNVAGYVITADRDAMVVAGSTLTRGAPPITISGTPIYFGSSALVVGTSTVLLAPNAPTQMITTIAGQGITAASNIVAIAGNTLSPGAPGATIDGTILSLDAAGHFVLGSKTIPFASNVPETLTTTIAGQVITAAPSGIAVAGTTLIPGAPGTTLDGTLLSLDTANHLIVGSKTISLASASPSPLTTTIGGQVITAAPDRIAIAGTALTPGASGVTVGGTLVSLNTAGQLVIGSKTIALQSGSTSLGALITAGLGAASPSEIPDPITTTIDGQAITAAPTALIMAGTTLTPGAAGFTVNGTLVSLNTAAQLVVGSKTIPLESEPAGSSGQSAGLAGLIMGGFGNGGPFGPVASSSPSPAPARGNVTAGAVNGTSPGVQVFTGNAVRLKGHSLRDTTAVAAIVVSFLSYMC